MGDRLVDPYEQQLLGVFESCDDEQKGSLDRHGLLNLCNKLQLEEQGIELMECLLDGAADRVTFVEFRDGLLALLDQGEGDKDPPRSDLCLPEALPEREVSPKFVFGKKKYGRRTRPKHTDLNLTENVEESDSDNSIETETDLSSNNSKVESLKGNAQHPKKRKTSVKVLVKQTPDVAEPITGDVLADDTAVTSTVFTLASCDNEVQCLRNAWKRLGVGNDGYLDRNELALVCDHIGMEKVAGEVVKEVFDTLDVDRDNRISFEEFLLLFRGGGRANQTESDSSSLEDNPLRFSYRLSTNAGEHQSILCASGDSAYVWTLDASGNGMVNADMVVEVWENAGVPDASLLLQNLGFTEPLVKVTELITVVDSEISGLQAENAGQGVMTATEILQQASFALCVTQVRCMKSTLEQVCRERDKLRFDIAEANERASLLAQEVDEHHSRLEHSNRAHIKSLEAKHADQVKYLTDQLSHERDHLAHQTAALQSRVRELEEAESHQRSEFAAHKEESAALYRENQSLVEQLAHTEVEYATARKELETLDGLRQGMREMELNNDNEKVSLLLEKLDDVQCENTELRDRNDELTMKVEALSLELAAVSLKKSGPQYSLDVVDKRMIEQECAATDDMIVAGGGGATKRRGDPPLSMSACEESSEEESPRLEKVRRCCSSPHDIDLLGNGGGIQVRTLTPSGSVVDLMLSPDGKMPYSQGDNLNVHPASRTCVSLVQSPPSATETMLREQINTLQHQLKIFTDKLEVFEAEKDQGLKECHEQKSPFSSPQITIISSQMCDAKLSTKELNDCGNTKEQLEQHCRDLKSQLDEVKVEIVKILSERNACSKENCALKSHISDLKTNFVQPISSLSDNSTMADSLNRLGSSDIFALKTEPDPSLELKSVLEGNDAASIILREDTTELNTEKSDTIEALKREFADKFSMVEENHMKEKIELLERCTNLESSIELLRQEYERCEDYWAGKLDEERSMHDQEQQDYDTKYKSVLAELQTYDEYFQPDMGFAGSSRRLATIDENVLLESQVNALQEECEELRTQMLTDRLDMAKECQLLEEQLRESELTLRATREQCQQCGPAHIVPDVLNSRVNWSTDAEGYLQARYKGNPLDNDKHLLNPRMPVQSVDAAVQVPDMNHKSWPYNTVNDMHVAREQLISQISELERWKYQILEEINEEQTIGFGGNGCQRIACQVDMKILQTMNMRWVQHDQRSRHMQMALKQRQRHTDMLLQQTWIKHKKEIAELEIILGTTQKNLQQQSLAYKEQLDRLLRNDVLVKDLYVENAYLVATVQRLEQRCMALAQMTTDSISV